MLDSIRCCGYKSFNLNMHYEDFYDLDFGKENCIKDKNRLIIYADSVRFIPYDYSI